jgi:transcriptional regulator with XRE-family HTH domain
MVPVAGGCGLRRGAGIMAELLVPGFAGLLRELRAEARLTQEELGEAAGLSPRSVSDLERGVNRTARKDTAALLAGALGLAEPVRSLFVAAARGKVPAEKVLAAVRRQGRRAAGEVVLAEILIRRGGSGYLVFGGAGSAGCSPRSARCGMMIGCAAPTGLSRCDERVRVPTASSGE